MWTRTASLEVRGRIRDASVVTDNLPLCVAPCDSKSDHKRLAPSVGAILVIAHRQAALSKANTRFAPTYSTKQCPNVMWFNLVARISRGDSYASDLQRSREERFCLISEAHKEKKAARNDSSGLFVNKLLG